MAAFDPILPLVPSGIKRQVSEWSDRSGDFATKNSPAFADFGLLLELRPL